LAKYPRRPVILAFFSRSRATKRSFDDAGSSRVRT
jgi:hypothetical protein